MMSNLLTTIKESGKKRRRGKSRKDVIYYFMHNSEQPIGYIL
jgi:hypothetical protein